MLRSEGNFSHRLRITKFHFDAMFILTWRKRIFSCGPYYMLRRAAGYFFFTETFRSFVSQLYQNSP